jgi:hypothetical protein
MREGGGWSYGCWCPGRVFRTPFLCEMFDKDANETVGCGLESRKSR